MDALGDGSQILAAAGTGRSRGLAVVVAVTALLAAGVGYLWATPGGSDVLVLSGTAPEHQVRAAPVESPVTAAQSESLDAAYERCAVAAGFDPGGVQVLLDVAGTPEWVKTGRDVPAAVHRPCFVRIGGTDPHRSSHGYPG